MALSACFDAPVKRPARYRAVVGALLVLLMLAGATIVQVAAARPAAAAVTPTPSGLTVRNLVGNALDIRWNAAAGAVSYQLTLTRSDGSSIGPRVVIGTQYSWTALTVGESYRAQLRAQGLLDFSDPAVAAPVVVVSDRTNDPVTAATSEVLPGTTKVKVAWQHAPGGFVPFLTALRVKRAGLVVHQDWCAYPCTTKVVDGLAPGLYTIDVIATNFFPGPTYVPANPVLLFNPCAGGPVCVTVDAAATRGPAVKRAQGVLASLGGVAPAMVDPLEIAQARVSDWEDWLVAIQRNMNITVLLSSLWQGTTWTGVGAARPWDNWTKYDKFVGDWVTFTKLFGIRVDYWEIQNEPYGDYFSKAESWYPVSDELYLQHYLHGYRAVKAADPNAKVVAPSFGWWDPNRMRAFLDFAVTNNLRFDAYAWHELSAKPTEGPQAVGAHVTEMRQLLADRPTLGAPKLFINEYIKPTAMHLAGWETAWVAALEDSDIDQANRTCTTLVRCYQPNLVDMVDQATQLPRGSWWVHRFYARQTGTRLVTTSSNDDVTGFSTVDGGVVRTMVGRNETCVMAVNPDCFELAGAPAYDLPVTVRAAWASGTAVRVVVERIPATNNVVLAPTVAFDTTLTADDAGSVTVIVPLVADGEAMTLVATPLA